MLRRALLVSVALTQTMALAGCTAARPGFLEQGGAANIGPYGAPKSSLGCGLAAPPAGVLRDQPIDVNGTRRTYVLSVPAGYASNRPLALVFGFHGHSGTGYGTLLDLQDLEARAAGAAIFVYPDGLGGVWDPSDGGADVQLFDALVQDLGARYCIDRNRVFATGFSFGGSMTSSLGCFRGNAIRAIAPQAGGNLWPSSAQCRGQVPVWIAFGAQDDPNYLNQYCRPSREFWRSANHCGTSAWPVSPDPSCQAYGGCDRGFPVIACEWPGGHSWAPFGAVAIWDFFASFP
jgi:poly(3-hydroxybutyrate) depolymerase